MKLTSCRGHHFLMAPLNEESVVVDLGAHKGDFSSELARVLGCSCYAVEAMPGFLPRDMDAGRIRSFNIAISDRDAPVALHVSNNPEFNRLVAHKWVSDAVITVPGQTLESFLRAEGLESVDLLKVDIEGEEIALFDSLTDGRLRRFGQITVEFHDFIPDLRLGADVRRVIQRLRSLGFACVVFSRRSHGDVLFIRRETSGASWWEWLYLTRVSRYTEGIRRLFGRLMHGGGGKSHD